MRAGSDPMVDHIRAMCFPQHDALFAADVARVVRRAAEHDREPIGTAVESLLREAYATAVVWVRQGAISRDGRKVWYVLRDGSILPGPDGGP